MKKNIPDGPVIGLSGSACMREITDSKEGAQRIVAVVSGRQSPGLDTRENTAEQQKIWHYLLQHKMAMRPRHVLSEANKRIDEIFTPQKIASLGRLPDDFWNSRISLERGETIYFSYNSQMNFLSEKLKQTLCTLRGQYDSCWMENGVWYGQLPSGFAEDITAEVAPQVARFMNENLYLFPDPVQQAKIPTGAKDNLHSRFYHKPGAIWVSPQDFGDVFEMQEPDIRAALRYEMIRGTYDMRQLVQRLKKPDTTEQDIGDIIRGVKAFDLREMDGGNRDVDTPEQFRVS